METRSNGGKIFYFIIPVLILLGSFIYDNAIMIVTEKRYRLESENIIKEVLGNSYTDEDKINIVGELYKEKKYETDQLSVRYEDNVIYVYNVHIYPSFLARIVGVNSYRTEIDLKGYIKDEEIIIEENQG